MTALLRLVFLALIGLGLASQMVRAGRGNDAADPQGALRERLRHLDVQATAGPDAGLLWVRSPRCGQPFAVALMSIDGADDEIARRVAAPDTVLRYVYLGAVEDRPRRAALVARWGWAALRFTAGLRPGRPPRHMAMVAVPRSCTGLDGVDWAVLSPPE